MQAAKAADSEEAAARQAEALQQRLALLTGKLSEAEDERRAELAPDIHAAKEDMALLRSQLETERDKAAAAGREAADIAAKLEAVGLALRAWQTASPACPACGCQLWGQQHAVGLLARHWDTAVTCPASRRLPAVQIQLEVEGLRLALGEEQEVAAGAELQPSRLSHQADLAMAALRQLREEEQEVAAQLRTHEAAEQAVLLVGGSACVCVGCVCARVCVHLRACACACGPVYVAAWAVV